MRTIFNFTVALTLLGIGPLLAADSARVISTPHVTTAGMAAGLPNFVAGMIIASQPDPAGAVPCFNCVPRSEIVTLGLGLPQSIFLVNAPVLFQVTGDDLSYSGPCTFEYHLSTSVAGPPIQEGTVPTECYPSVWIAYFPANVPTTPGRYFMSGGIYTGSGAVKTIVNSMLIVVNNP